jgi:hypothetical protein
MNKRDEIVGVFIREKVGLENSLSQSDGGVPGRGRIRVEKQTVEDRRTRTSSGPERRRPPETQKFDLYHPMVPLPHSDTLPHIHTTGLHLGCLSSTACFTNRTCPLPVTPLSNWLRLFLSQTFSHIELELRQRGGTKQSQCT